MAVQQHVLNWLYSVLTSEYHDVNRTYNDVAQALSQYPSLAPRTDVHTFPNGTSALLLHLSGTLPVVFRGTTYRFPLSIWIPHAYPREAPLIYVTPTDTMVVRPGQHVDPQGQVYHPYLVGWTTFWDKSSILDFLAILRDVFAKEPPVISRQQDRSAPPTQSQSPAPPPLPPLPAHLSSPGGSQTGSPPVSGQAGPPPPPPPKTNNFVSAVSSLQPSPAVSPGPREPPLPPLPPAIARAQAQHGADPSQQYRPTVGGASRYDSAPPLPPQAQQLPQQMIPAQYQAVGQPAAAGTTQYRYGSPQAIPSPGGQAQPQFAPNNPGQVAGYGPPQPYGSPPPPWQQRQQQPLPPAFAAQQQQPQQQLQPKPPPPPDLMDEPLTLAIPSPSSVPAPPIPPNPEKDALLHQLGSTLYSLRHRSRAQNESSLLGLQAQRNAMLSTLAAIQSDVSALTQLSALLNSNSAILKDSLRRADAVIESSASQPAPGIDELLVAPTVVGNQLYDLVAEERALADAIFVLGRAMEKGRIAPGNFAKTTRSLAREWYLKKALVKKIGKGMGLTAM